MGIEHQFDRTERDSALFEARENSPTEPSAARKRAHPKVFDLESTVPEGSYASAAHILAELSSNEKDSRGLGECRRIGEGGAISTGDGKAGCAVCEVLGEQRVGRWIGHGDGAEGEHGPIVPFRAR